MADVVEGLHTLLLVREYPWSKKSSVLGAMDDSHVSLLFVNSRLQYLIHPLATLQVQGNDARDV